MFCTKCGSEIRDGSLFCPKCGADLRKATAQPEVLENVPAEPAPVEKDVPPAAGSFQQGASVTGTYQEPVQTQPQGQYGGTPSYSPPAKKSGKGCLVVVFAFLLVAGALLLVMSMIKNAKYDAVYLADVDNYSGQGIEITADQGYDYYATVPDDVLSDINTSAYLPDYEGTYTGTIEFYFNEGDFSEIGIDEASIEMYKGLGKGPFDSTAELYDGALRIVSCECDYFTGSNVNTGALNIEPEYGVATVSAENWEGDYLVLTSETMYFKNDGGIFYQFDFILTKDGENAGEWIQRVNLRRE